MAEKLLGVIGGSGLYKMEGLEVTEKVTLDTPFGAPSDEITVGTLHGTKMAFLPRHGVGHFLPPSEINFRANIFAMKKMAVQKIISVSAVGSMKEEYLPGHFVVPDQFIDRTNRRISTFFKEGIVGHVGLADPICNYTSDVLFQAAKKAGALVHKGGTYICIEGPQFSTRAESNLYRQWGVDVIGMTNVTEAKLAREAGLCYSTLALVTDFDCWHIEEEPVTLEAVLEIMHKNVQKAQKVISELVPMLENIEPCNCSDASKYAVVTDPKKIPEKLKEDFSILFG
ncbi:MAG: S-methyl-5'-thioadenosine phosphorylase [Nitrospina sp.]|nr:S-methyl-5'-thioadenosine phosphorylase [Nitrospina sp.]|tara:strand:- start:2775 stop:3626 length:852 start_codon:yes stop_codon:yes gene_type:complete